MSQRSKRGHRRCNKERNESLTIREAQKACRIKRPQSIREWLPAAEQEMLNLAGIKKSI